jgi:anti-sigma-K factor RskA
MNDAHERWDELAAGYALHALELEEEQEFTAHLGTCAECDRLLQDHELVAAQLGSLAHDEDLVAPSWSSVRRGVIDDGAAPVVSLTERRRRRQPRLLGAAAAVVVLAAGGVVAWQATSGSPSAATQAIDTCRHQRGCEVIPLHASAGGNPGAVLVANGKVTMVPIAMGAPAAGKTYVLWQMLRNGSPTPVDSFRGSAAATWPLVVPYDDTAAFAVSVEPAGLPPSQPTHVVAVGNTSA